MNDPTESDPPSESHGVEADAEDRLRHGSSFGAAGKGYLRFSYAASLEDIDWALQSIRETLPKFRG